MKWSKNEKTAEQLDIGDSAGASSLINIPEDIFHHVARFLTGKNVSTLIMALVSSSWGSSLLPNNNSKNHSHDLARVFILSLTARCDAFLKCVDAPQDLRNVLKDQSKSLLKEDCSLKKNMKKISEFFAFVDYCEVLPPIIRRRLEVNMGEEDQEESDNDPKNICWIVAMGHLGVERSPVMLSTPHWRKELISLGEKWLNPSELPKNQNLNSFFDIESVNDIKDHIAILSWKDSKFLAEQHRINDIEAGNIAYHGESSGNCLLWLPKATCEMFPSVRNEIKHSDLSWLLPGTQYDNDMLCSYEINDYEVEPYSADIFGEGIVSLLHAAEDWCRDGGDRVRVVNKKRRVT